MLCTIKAQVSCTTGRKISFFLCEGLRTSKVPRCAPMGNVFHFSVLEHKTATCVPFNSARVLLEGTQHRHLPTSRKRPLLRLQRCMLPRTFSTAVRHHRTALSGPPLPRGLAPGPARPPGFALSRRGSVAFPSSSRTSSTLRQRLLVLWYRCDDYLIKISFSWLLRRSQGPFLSPIEVGSASSKVVERAPCGARQGHSLAIPTV